jgi:hypothetical protein
MQGECDCYHPNRISACRKSKFVDKIYNIVMDATKRVAVAETVLGEPISWA